MQSFIWKTLLETTFFKLADSAQFSIHQIVILEVLTDQSFNFDAIKRGHYLLYNCLFEEKNKFIDQN